MTLEEILAKMGSGADASEFADKEPFDVLVVGGGPAGASAAIYTARKGIRTGVVAERFGGQVLDTMSIENFISVKATEGPKLAASLEEHVKEYDIDVMNLQRAKRLEKKDLFELELENGAVLKSKTVILSTGARWRNVNVPGEQEFKNKGVAYCPHCDGPLFEGKDVAVIGGGNSGIEAAIDLAGIVNHVTVLEFAPELKADEVLQKRLYSLPNVTVLKNAQTKEITGDQSVNGITYVDRETGEEKHVELQGVFVQIGLVPNTEWLDETVERNRIGEIVVDKHGATSSQAYSLPVTAQTVRSIKLLFRWDQVQRPLSARLITLSVTNIRKPQYCQIGSIAAFFFIPKILHVLYNCNIVVMLVNGHFTLSIFAVFKAIRTDFLFKVP